MEGQRILTVNYRLGAQASSLDPNLSKVLLVDQGMTSARCSWPHLFLFRLSESYFDLLLLESMCADAVL